MHINPVVTDALDLKSLKERSTYVLRFLLGFTPSNIYFTLNYLKDSDNKVTPDIEKIIKINNTTRDIFERELSMLLSTGLVERDGTGVYTVYGYVVEDWVYLTNDLWNHLENVTGITIREAVEESEAILEVDEEPSELGGVLSKLPSKNQNLNIEENGEIVMPINEFKEINKSNPDKLKALIVKLVGDDDNSD